MQKNVSTQTKNNFVTRRVPMCLEVAQGKLMYIYILDIPCYIYIYIYFIQFNITIFPPNDDAF